MRKFYMKLCTLTLVWKSNNDATFRADWVDERKVTNSQISLFVPHILPNDCDKLPLYKTIEDEVKLRLVFRIR